MDDADKNAALQRLIDEAPVTPAKPTKEKTMTDPPTHVSVEDLATGNWHLFKSDSPCNIQMYIYIFDIFFRKSFSFSSSSSSSSFIAPGSATKLLQEESKHEMPKQEETKQEVPKQLTDIDLPLIYEEPIFKEKFMIYYDKEKDSVRLVKDTTISLVASLAITVKDVYRFSETLELEDAFALPGDQRLRMVACHTSEMREVFMTQIMSFLNFEID